MAKRTAEQTLRDEVKVAERELELRRRRAELRVEAEIAAKAATRDAQRAVDESFARLRRSEAALDALVGKVAEREPADDGTAAT